MNRLQQKLRHWRGLEPWERRLFTRLYFLLPTIWSALRLLGFNRMRGMAESEIQTGLMKPELPAMDFAQRCAELTAITARNGLYRANCLHQSLALCWVLRRHGLPARIRIGVLPRTQPFQAHAWVELYGAPLGQQSIAEYEAFESLKANPENVHFE